MSEKSITISENRRLANPKSVEILKKVEKLYQMETKQAKIYILTGADGKAYASETKGTLGGHRKDKIYGTLDCKGAARWIAKGHYVKNRIFFADEQTAIAAGYRPCYECLRGKYNEWKSNQQKVKSFYE